MPPAIDTSEAGSFARFTMVERIPSILERARRGAASGPAVDAAFERLLREVRADGVTPLREAAPDRTFWDTAVAPHQGRSWLALPWLFAEAYVYRRILEASGFVQPGPGLGRDPFSGEKRAELSEERGLARVATVLGELDRLRDDAAQRLGHLLLATLWGNRVDLSHSSTELRDSPTTDALLVDDSDAVVGYLCDCHPTQISLIADNAGTELLMDLLLVDELGRSFHPVHIDLYIKPYPIFVSDAVAGDVADALSALSGAGGRAGAVAARLEQMLGARSLEVVSSSFFGSSLCFVDLPTDVRQRLSSSALTLCKGDANYRRLCSDAHWPRSTPFSDVVSYFPSPVAALRTLKSELLVGVASERADALDHSEPGWLTSGRYGVVQAYLDPART